MLLHGATSRPALTQLPSEERNGLLHLLSSGAHAYLVYAHLGCKFSFAEAGASDGPHGALQVAAVLLCDDGHGTGGSAC